MKSFVKLVGAVAVVMGALSGQAFAGAEPEDPTVEVDCTTPGVSCQTNAVPEPDSLALVLMGLIGVVAAQRSRNKKK